MSNSRIIYEDGTRKDLEERGCGPITVLSKHLPGETEDNHEKPQSV
jgi:hypothetical protein